MRNFTAILKKAVGQCEEVDASFDDVEIFLDQNLSISISFYQRGPRKEVEVRTTHGRLTIYPGASNAITIGVENL